MRYVNTHKHRYVYVIYSELLIEDKIRISVLSFLSFFSSFSLPDVLCDPTDLIWRKNTAFEAMNVHTSPSSDSLLAEVFLGFSSAVRQIPRYLCTAPEIISFSPLSLANDVIFLTLGASGLWLGT